MLVKKRKIIKTSEMKYRTLLKDLIKNQMTRTTQKMKLSMKDFSSKCDQSTFKYKTASPEQAKQN